MYDEKILFAVGACFVIALAFVPASAATSATDEAPPSAPCVRIDPNEPSVSVHPKCDHSGVPADAEGEAPEDRLQGSLDPR